MRTLPIKLLLGACALALSFAACDDSMSNGNSIVDDQVDIFIDTTFTTTAHTVDNNAVISRTTTGLLGSIDAGAYGSLTSDIATQFMPAIEMDTALKAVNSIDAVNLVMRYALDGFVGDSVAPMGLEVYELNKALPSPIYSDFNPEGYYNPANKLGSLIYTATRENASDSIKKLTYGEMQVSLPRELGRRLYAKYLSDPASFSSPEEFAKFFPGLYIKNSYGSGRVMRIIQTTIDMHYHVDTQIDDKDTTLLKTSTYFAVTPEIICNNNIEYALSQDLKDRRAKGQTLIVAPAGYEAELTFPTREIIASYKKNIGSGLGIINQLNYEIPAELIANDYGINPPPFLLMVLKNQKDAFFAENKITDNKTSFYAQYDASTKSYSFGSLRTYLLDMMEKEEITDDDITFIVTPVHVSTESNSDYWGSTTTYVTSITPYVFQPAMVRLLIDKAKVRFVYSRQTLAL